MFEEILRELTEAGRHARLICSAQNSRLFHYRANKKAIRDSYVKKIHRMTDCTRLLQQRIKTSEQTPSYKNDVQPVADGDIIRHVKIGLPETRTMKLTTVTCFCHSGCCYTIRQVFAYSSYFSKSVPHNEQGTLVFRH